VPPEVKGKPGVLSPSGSVPPDAADAPGTVTASADLRQGADELTRYDPLTGPRPRFIPKADLPGIGADSGAPQGSVPKADLPGIGADSGAPEGSAPPEAAPAVAAAPALFSPAAAAPEQVSSAGPAGARGFAADLHALVGTPAAPGGPRDPFGHGSEGTSGGWGSGSGSLAMPPPSWPTQPGKRRRRSTVLGIAAAVGVIIAGGGTYVYLQKPSPAEAAGTDHDHKASSPAAAPEHVLSVTPANGATGVNGAAAITVAFSEPLSATSPLPTVSPAIGGAWQRRGNNAVFVPTRGFGPRTKVTVRIPGGSVGVQSSGGGQLATSVTAKFRTGRYSNVRLEQLLAQLGYLPLTWSPLNGAAAPLSDAREQLSAAYNPPAGTYVWQSGWPSALARLWRPDKPSQILRGAVMAFQADHGLTSDMIYENQQGLTLRGSIGHRLWRAMFRAITRDETNTHGYTYALANQKAPETLTVWHNGVQIFKHLANTGIPVRPTAVRTDPVYIRYRSQIMRGTNPDGSKYADPVAWVAYFHGGEAIHYFPRYSYGSQQSLGCVELPLGPAKRIWPYLTFGTLVTVTAP